MAKAKKAAPARSITKIGKLITMLRREEGATIAQLCTGLDWQPHSVRGALAGTLKKQGLKVSSTKEQGAERIYRIVE